jgi:hypothetical protein
MKPIRRATYRAKKNQSSNNNRKPKKLTFKGGIASCSLAILLSGFAYESFKWREIDVEIANVMEVVARRSNPCYSYQKLETTAKFIKSKNLDSGNTAVIPDTPLYASEGENYSVDTWYNQVLESVIDYKYLCDQLIAIDPKIAEYEENETIGEENYRKLKSSNPKLNDRILTADFTVASTGIDSKLIRDKGKAIIPEGLHLMPFIRQFLLIRYISLAILLFCYLGPAIGFLSGKKTFKFGFNMLNILAPWRL